MSNINPHSPSKSAYERLVNLDKYLLSSSNSSLFGGGGAFEQDEQRNYSLFNGNKDWPTVDSPRSRIPPIENLSIVEINQIQEGLKKLFGMQSQLQGDLPVNTDSDPPVLPPAAHSPDSPLPNYSSGRNSGISPCRTAHGATIQESRSQVSISSTTKNSSPAAGWANNLNNSWPIMDTDFTYSIGPNVQRQLEKSVIYSNTQTQTSQIQSDQSATGKASWTQLSKRFGDIPTTPSASILTQCNNHQSLNRDKMRCVVPNFCRADLTNDPTVFYRFYQFECICNKKIWFSPLAKAKDGLFCWACTHFVKPFAHFDGTTPYQGSELCYGKFECHVCKNTWSSRRSMANVSEKCFGCGASIYPYYQVTLTTVEKKKRRVETTTYRDEHGEIDHFINSSRGSSSPRESYYESEAVNHGLVMSTRNPMKTITNQVSARETSRNRLKKSQLGFSLSSPALVQKLEKNIT